MWGNLEPRGLGVLGGGVQGSPTLLILIWSLFLPGWVPSCGAELPDLGRSKSG